jgi:hypothetical protein
MKFHLRKEARHRLAKGRRLAIIITIGATIPALIVFFCENLQSITESFSFLNFHQSLDNLLNRAYLSRNRGARGESSMDSELGR